MPVRRIKKKDVPPATRNRESPLKKTPEWGDVLAVLAQGLKPHEAVEVSLAPESVAKLQLKNPSNATRLLRNLIRDKVKELKLQYDVWQQGGPGGTVIYIAGQ